MSRHRRVLESGRNARPPPALRSVIFVQPRFPFAPGPKPSFVPTSPHTSTNARSMRGCITQGKGLRPHLTHNSLFAKGDTVCYLFCYLPCLAQHFASSIVWTRTARLGGAPVVVPVSESRPKPSDDFRVAECKSSTPRLTILDSSLIQLHSGEGVPLRYIYPPNCLPRGETVPLWHRLKAGLVRVTRWSRARESAHQRGVISHALLSSAWFLAPVEMCLRLNSRQFPRSSSAKMGLFRQPSRRSPFQDRAS